MMFASVATVWGSVRDATGQVGGGECKLGKTDWVHLQRKELIH